MGMWNTPVNRWETCFSTREPISVFQHFHRVPVRPERSKPKCHGCKKTVHAGRCIYIQRHYSSRYGSKHKCTRGSNYGKTSEAQAIVNNRQACLQQEMIFNANFGPGDLTATFTFRKADRPKNLQEIKKLWAAYMVKLRYAYKKAGVEFKWMRAIETPGQEPAYSHGAVRHRHSQAASVAVWAGGLCAG